VLEALQVHPERRVELCDRSGQDDGTPARVFLNDRETMLGRKFFDRGNVAGRGTVLLVEFVPRGMAALPLTPSELPHPLCQLVGVVPPQQYGNLQALSGIGLADRFRPYDRTALAALQWLLCHYTNSFTDYSTSFYWRRPSWDGRLA
jgi:hypothetical protein